MKMSLVIEKEKEEKNNHWDKKGRKNKGEEVRGNGWWSEGRLGMRGEEVKGMEGEGVRRVDLEGVRGRE